MQVLPAGTPGIVCPAWTEGKTEVSLGAGELQGGVAGQDDEVGPGQRVAVPGLDWLEKVQSSVQILIDLPVFPGGKSYSGSITAAQIVGVSVGRDALPGQSGHQPNPSLAEIRTYILT